MAVIGATFKITCVFSIRIKRKTEQMTIYGNLNFQLKKRIAKQIINLITQSMHGCLYNSKFII